MKKFLSNKIVGRVIVVLICILAVGSIFLGGMFVESKLADCKILFDTYCESGVVAQKLDEGYLLRLDNGKYRLFDSAETFADNTKVIVCFEMNDTDKTEDDRIIAISTDLYALSESLFTEEVAPTVG
jgi:hypothetical protein